MNVRIISITSGETCSGCVFEGKPTEDPITHTGGEVLPGDVLDEDEFEKLGHRRECAFHRGETCDFDFAQEEPQG